MNDRLTARGPLRSWAVFLLLVFFFPGTLFSEDYTSNLVRQAREKQLWKEKQWLDLGHYRKGIGGNYKSQVDGLEFFLAGIQGKKDPQIELEATLTALFSQKPVGDDAAKSLTRDKHPSCRFPARTLWLKKKLNLNGLPQISCPLFDTFRNLLRARSVSLVFSAYFLNNPASAFGHTLLRINKSDRAQDLLHNELLDTGINFGANTTTSNPMFYAILGLTGGFKGNFAVVPYYYKVREYSDSESRDLWSYDLDLTQPEVEMLVAHLWELGSTYFDYYYLTENCSYHMLSALEAAAPRYDFIDPLPYYVIPSDTIKIVTANQGAVMRIHFRPAIRTQFAHRLKSLDNKDRAALKKLIKRQDIGVLPPAPDPAKKAQVLDAAIDYWDYKHFEELNKKGTEAIQFKQKLLLARSEIPVTSPPSAPSPPENEQPHRGHESSRLGFNGGYSDRLGAYTGVSHRFALHDRLDPLPGYPEYAEIEFLNLEIRKNFEERWFWLEEASAFSVVSLSDFTQFNKTPSWKIRLGGRTFRDEVCTHCFGGLMDGGIGITKKWGEDLPVLASLTLDGEVSGSPAFRGVDVRFRYGPMAQIRTSFRPHLQLLMSSRYRRPLISDFSPSIESEARARWGVMRNLAFDVRISQFWRPDSWEGGLGLLFYY